MEDVDVLGNVDLELEDVRSGRFVENDLNLKTTIVHSFFRQERIRVQFLFVSFRSIPSVRDWREDIAGA